MKKFLSILLAFVMLLGVLCSCNDADKDVNIPSDDTNTPSGEESSKEDGAGFQENADNTYYIPISIVNQYEGKTVSSKITLGDNGLPANITYGDESQPDRDYTYDSDGNVIKIENTYATGDKTSAEYTYGENGKVVNNTYMSVSGSEETIDYSYDSSGNLVKTVSTFPNGGCQIFDRTYDADGNLIKTVYSYGDGDKDTWEYIYDADGKLIKKTFTNYDGEVSVTDYNYDAEGRMTGEFCTSNDGSKTSTECSYDASGELKQKILTYKNGTKETRDYANGKLIKSVNVHAFAGTITYEYTYDMNGNRIKRVYTYYKANNPDNPVVVVDEYTYDEYGNVIKMITASGDGKISQSVEVEYRAVVIPNGLPTQIQAAIDDLLIAVYAGPEQ